MSRLSFRVNSSLVVTACIYGAAVEQVLATAFKCQTVLVFQEQ